MYRISLSFSQIMDLVRQLPFNEKVKLGKEIEQEARNIKLSELLSTFRTDELTEDVINTEVDIVRQEIYDEKKKSKGNN